MIELLTPNLRLVPPTLQEFREWLENMPPEEKKHVSADWLARVKATTEIDPWIHGFSISHKESAMPVGRAGFTAPPDENGFVEIAYGIFPPHQGKGYATEAAAALFNFAKESSRVKIVRAHTLQESNASTRVLSKCGFTRVGEVIDPNDGLVWRWEKAVRSR